MARVTLMPNGCTGSFPRLGTPSAITPRAECQGWTLQVTRRFRRKLYAVDGEALDGVGCSFSLTVLELPPSANDWTTTHQRFVRLLRKDGLIRGQWLTEFQKRRVPHLHGCAFFPEGTENVDELVTKHWLAAAAPWAPEEQSQSVHDLYGLVGWFQYQAKHSARGVRHYQRANLPEAWMKRTGRLWGFVGPWPTKELAFDVDPRTYWRLRRLLQQWLISGCRSKLDDPKELHRLAYLRRMLADPDPKRSAVRAIGEFCPESVARQLLMAATHEDTWARRLTSGSGSVEAEPPKGGA